MKSLEVINKNLDQLKLAKDNLNKILSYEERDKEDTVVKRGASIQAFENAFELAWKLMKRIIEINGETIENFGVKGTIRKAAQIGLVEDPNLWFAFSDARNLASHTYNESNADNVYSKAKEFPKEIDSFIKKVEEFITTYSSSN